MKNWMIGMDLQMEYAQFCYFDEENKDAVCLSEEEGEEATRYENNLFFLTEDKSWHCAAQAQELYMTKPGQYYTDILKRLEDRSVIIVDGQEYDYTDLFCILVKLQLEQCFGEDLSGLSKLVISSPMADAHLNRAVHRLAKFLKLEREQVELVSPVISTLFYVFAQDTSVWSNGVALFHYGNQGMQFERIQVQRYQRPMKITVTEETLLDMPAWDAESQEKDEAFKNLCRTVFAGRNNNASGVYLLGDGFSQNWLNASADALCRGRRVFVGQNLNVKGACYAAASGSATISQDGSIYVKAPGMIHYDIGVKVWYQGREQIAPIALGEQEWFNIDGSATIFLDETNRIEIAMYHRGRNELVKEIIEIKGLPKRPPKTTKLEIRVRYLDERRGEICIRDKGFGTMYPTTGKVYRKEFMLPEED
ncbi:MAG: DUF5716 family protein [Lachnospiraceae bacterium]|nr:DUF5716 family protein [Lachnospiraceae bacterium]